MAQMGPLPSAPARFSPWPDGMSKLPNAKIGVTNAVRLQATPLHLTSSSYNAL